MTRRRSRAGASRRVVVFDLDCTLLRPRARMQAALAAMADDGVPEFASLDCWAMLPGLHHRGWPTFIAYHGLDRRYPRRAWPVLEAAWRRLLSWEPAALRTDELAPGARDLVLALWQRGIEPLVLTGRPEWMRESSLDALAELGLPVPVRCAPRGVGSTSAGKVAALERLGVEVVGAVDDEIENVRALSAAWPGALVLHHSPEGFTADPRAAGAPQLTGFDLEHALIGAA